MKLLNYYFSFIPNKFIRFIFVGGLNTAFGMGLYCLLIFIGLQYTVATLIAHILGVFFNFFTTGKFVFNNTDKKLVFRFCIAYTVTYFINIGINKSTQVYIGLNSYCAGICATILTALCSFVIMKYFVFVTKTTKKNEKN